MCVIFFFISNVLLSRFVEKFASCSDKKMKLRWYQFCVFACQDVAFSGYLNFTLYAINLFSSLFFLLDSYFSRSYLILFFWLSLLFLPLTEYNMIFACCNITSFSFFNRIKMTSVELYTLLCKEKWFHRI